MSPRKGRSTVTGFSNSYHREPQTTGFRCSNCRAFVPTSHLVSGVNNRNHCPYCLWSRHVDLNKAGDRLAACRGPMRPVGLTQKRVKKKYQTGRGELMLIHACTQCDAVSINRLAADDNPYLILRVFEGSNRTDSDVRERIEKDDIAILEPSRAELVERQLFGQSQSDNRQMHVTILSGQ